jgi:uncharacterized tellurite resistance protein B-like protein
MARSDFAESETEIERIRALLQQRFGMPAQAVQTLITEAGRRADRAVSLHEFTHRLNGELTAEEKFAIIEMLWRVSFADNRIDKHEEYLILRIAGLLHVPDRERIRAKLKVIVAEQGSSGAERENSAEDAPEDANRET